MDEDSFDYESEAVLASTHVQDLIALAQTYDAISDRKMKQVLLAAADQVLLRLSLQVHPTAPTKQ